MRSTETTPELGEAALTHVDQIRGRSGPRLARRIASPVAVRFDASCPVW